MGRHIMLESTLPPNLFYLSLHWLTPRSAAAIIKYDDTDDRFDSTSADSKDQLHSRNPAGVVWYNKHLQVCETACVLALKVL
jgi:hypothetical protein